jgi:hypothetical protein
MRKSANLVLLMDGRMEKRVKSLQKMKVRSVICTRSRDVSLPHAASRSKANGKMKSTQIGIVLTSVIRMWLFPTHKLSLSLWVSMSLGPLEADKM